MELCEECWKNEHDEEDYRKHNIGFIKVNLEPQKEIQKRIVKNRKDCQKMSRILEDWKKIIQQAQIAENKQNEVLKASTANQLEQKSDIVRNLIQNHITDVRKFRETVFNELEELERKQRCIFGDAFDSDYDSFLNRSCSTPVETNFSSRSSAAQRQVLERVLQEELLKFNIGDDADNFAIRSSSTLERNDISMTVSGASQIARRALRRLMQDELLSDSIGGDDYTLSTRSSSPSMLDSTMTSAGNPDLSATAGSSRVEISEGSSESAVGDNRHVTPAQVNKKVASTLKRGKKRELVRVTQSAIGDEGIDCRRAVYNTATKEVICLKSTLTVLRLNGPNGKFEVSKEMNLKSDAYNYLCDITLDSNNSLYGLIENPKNEVKRVAVLDIMKNKELIEERKLLVTKGLPNGERVYWKLCAVGETVAVVVEDWRGREEKECNSVTLYRSHIRQQTVQLNISFNDLIPTDQLVLVNENTLLFFSDHITIAVVSLPSQQTTTATTSAHTSKLTSNRSQKLQPKSIKYIQLSDTGYIRSLVWIPSEESVQSDAAEGYLFASDSRGFSHVYKINLEKDMAEVAEGEERTIAPMEGKGRLDNIHIWCSIDSSTLFATTERPSGKPMLLNLEYTTP